MSQSAKTLGDVAVGETAVVRRVGCARATAVRLMEMGLLPGTKVTLRRVAPLGDPLELSIHGYALSIRRAEALLVSIAETPAIQGKPVVDESDTNEPTEPSSSRKPLQDALVGLEASSRVEPT